MTETPTERAERVEFLYEKCKRRGGGSMADVETLRNDVRAMHAAYNQLRHIIDSQAQRIQGGLDRIAELETERAALADELAEADPEYTVGNGITPWTRSTYTNAEAARKCAKLNNWADAVVMRRIVGEWAELVSEPDDTAGSTS